MRCKMVRKIALIVLFLFASTAFSGKDYLLISKCGQDLIMIYNEQVIKIENGKKVAYVRTNVIDVQDQMTTVSEIINRYGTETAKLKCDPL